jgi:hypothetical protein
MKVWVATLESSENGYCPVGVFSTRELAEEACRDSDPGTDSDLEFKILPLWIVPCFSYESNEDFGEHWTFYVHEEEVQ